jgi:hypothetical protein
LLFPFPQLGWREPFNDFYKNVTRYDMPDAGLKQMADRMAAQGEKIILANGGRKTTVNARDGYVINEEAEFVAPLEAPSGPGPFIEAEGAIDFEFAVFGGAAPYRWRIESGTIPEGLRFADGRLSGTAKSAGVYPVVIQVTDSAGKSLSRLVKLVVRTRNLAPAASKILSNVETTDTAVRDAMWLSVPSSLYAPTVREILRDGKRLGNGSTFYSITASGERKEDYYGFEWDQPQTIGLLGYHGGSVEENGGWFTSLRVEYRDAQGEWKPVEGLLISPSLAPGDEPFNKPHFVEYLLAFREVTTTAVRMIGQAGGARHWRSKLNYFTSITELSVHGALPRYEHLNR